VGVDHETGAGGRRLSWLLFREDVLGGAACAADLSAAFQPGQEARFLTGDLSPGPAREREWRRHTLALETLVKVMAARIGLKDWVFAYGTSPDSLTPAGGTEPYAVLLAQAFHAAEEGEAIALLALLASGSPPAGPRLLPPRARLLIARRGDPLPSLRLAVACRPFGTARRITSLLLHGGPDQPFWLADRTLGVRFSVDRGQVSFKAHHQVIQEALEDRCLKEGIDLA
jgi:hypothetical protein